MHGHSISENTVVVLNSLEPDAEGMSHCMPRPHGRIGLSCPHRRQNMIPARRKEALTRFSTQTHHRRIGGTTPRRAERMYASCAGGVSLADAFVHRCKRGGSQDTPASLTTAPGLGVGAQAKDTYVSEGGAL